MQKKWWLIACLLFLPALGFAQEKIRGNYEALNGVPKAHSVEKVVFEEFVNFGCPHCNALRLASKDIKTQYQGKVDFVLIPVKFQRDASDAPLRLFHIAQKLGRGSEVAEAIFDAKFKNGVDVFDPGITNYLAKTLGLGEAYSKEANAAWVTQAIQADAAKANRYKVDATPTVIIQGTLRMKLAHSMDEFIKALPQTIDDLLVAKKS